MVDREKITKVGDHQKIFTQLDIFLDQALSKEEAAPVADHVSDCQLCQQRMAELLAAKKVFFVTIDRKGSTSQYRTFLFELLQFDLGLNEPGSGKIR